MGANYTPSDGPWAPDYLSECYWDPLKIERDLQGMEDLDLNTLKVVLNLKRVLKAGQGPDLVTLDQNVLARFDDLVARATNHNVRLIVVAQAAWHGRPEWYDAAGRQRGEEARRLVEGFWRQLATRYANEKAIMSWSFAIEIAADFFEWDSTQVPLFQEWLKRKYGSVSALQSAWGCGSWPTGWTCPTSFSNVNLPFCKSGGACPGKLLDQFDGRNVENVNLNPPVVTWRDHGEGSPSNENASASGTPAAPFHAWLLDYQYFRQYQAAEWIKVQADAIRAVDPNHLLSLGVVQFAPIFRPNTNPNPNCAPFWPTHPTLHPTGYEGPTDVWPFDVRELTRFVDFVDIHYYPGYPFPASPSPCGYGHGEWPNYPAVPVPDAIQYADLTSACRLASNGGCDDQLEYARAWARWAYAGKPVIMGEFGQVTDAADRIGTTGQERIAAYNTQLLYRVAGDVSGYLGWSFHNWQYPQKVGIITAYNGIFEDPALPCTPPPGFSQCPTKWGLKFQTLALRAFNQTPPQEDTFARLVRGARRGSTYGPYAITPSILTGENYLQLLGGPLDPVPGVSLLDDSITIGPMTTTTSSNVPSFSGIPVNPDIDQRLAPWDSRVVSHDVPEVMVTGNTYAVAIKLRNTGTTAWTAPSICLLESPGLGVCRALPSPVFPGAQVTFSFNLAAGLLEGCRTYKWTLVDQNVFPPAGRAFGQTLTVDTHVAAPTSLSAPGPVVVATGGGSTVQPKFKGYVLDAARNAWLQTANTPAFSSDTGAFWGAKVALGNLDGTNPTELAVGHGPQQTVGSSPTTTIELWRKDFSNSFSLPVLLGTIGPVFGTIPTHGVNLAMGDVDGAFGTCTSPFAKGDELIVAGGPLTGWPVEIRVLKVNVCNSPPTYTLWKTINPNPPLTGGATVAAVDVDGDGRKEVVVGHGTDFIAHVSVYKYNTGTQIFDLLASARAFPGAAPPFGPGIDGIYDESHSIYDYGDDPDMPPPPCDPTIHYSTSVSGGDVYPDCPDTPREEIVATLGPFPANILLTTRNEGWTSILRYDPSAGTLTHVNQFGGYEATVQGLAPAVGDIHGDGVHDILTGAGPDPAATSMLRSFSRSCTSAAGARPRLLPRRALTPFTELFGANVTARPSLPPACPPLGLMSGGAFGNGEGSPAATAREVERFVVESPSGLFLSETDHGLILSRAQDLVARAIDGDAAEVSSVLDALRKILPFAVIDRQARETLGHLIDAVADRVIRAERNQPPTADAGDAVEVFAFEAREALVELDGSRSADADSSDDVSDIVRFSWSIEGRDLGEGRQASVLLPVGEHYVRLAVRDTVGQESTSTVQVVVRDGEAPNVAAKLAPEVLWPPDHRMVEISIQAWSRDIVDGALAVGLAAYESSEPDDAPGSGDGDTKGDVQVTPEGKVFVRAERDAGGEGRRYVLYLEAVDTSGNRGRAAVTVTVPLEEP